ncbi:TD and POZ domain-containing protein 1-like [Musca autumnalis]|uniref:TD and POZ domain-containing protein 1-like n=1 Tax=Musca autumnalis TaxID=221902 RepID=UPI003CF56B61
MTSKNQGRNSSNGSDISQIVSGIDTRGVTFLKTFHNRFLWEIKNWSQWDNGGNIDSPAFNVFVGNFGCTWKMQAIKKWNSQGNTATISVKYICGNNIQPQIKIAGIKCGQVEFSKEKLINTSDKYYDFELKPQEIEMIHSITTDTIQILLDINIKRPQQTVVAPIVVPTQSSIANDLARILASKDFSDVTLIANGGAEFRAHKLILCSRSEVFAAMFRNNFKENKTNRIEIDDIDAEVLEEMLNFIYTDKEIPKEMANALYYAANKYQLLDLQIMCENILTNTMDVTTVLDILLFAEQNANERLKTNALDYIMKNVKDIMATTEWKELQKTNPIICHNILFRTVYENL